MTTISTLTVDVTARTTRFRAGMRTVGIGLAAVGAAAFAAFREFEKSQQVAEQTEAVLKSTGGAANVTAKDIDTLTGALMKKTAIDDEAIRNGANLLLTFTNIRNEVGKGNAIFDRATSTILDMSTALDQDMKSSAIQLGKALNDPIRGITALRRVGVSFTSAQEKQIAKWVEQGDTLKAQRAILDELTKEFGGSAEAQVTGSKRMATALGELAEVAGQLLAPLIEKLITGALALAGFLQRNLAPALAGVRDWLSKVWESIGPVVTAFGSALVEAATEVWNSFRSKILPALVKLWNALKPVLKVVGILIGILIKLALEILPIVFNNFAVFVSVLASVVDFIRTKVLGPVIGFFQRLFERIGSILGKIGDVWSTIWEGAKSLFIGVWDAIKGAVQAGVNFLIGILNGLIDGLNAVLEGAARIASLGFSGAPNIPHIGTVGGSSGPSLSGGTGAGGGRGGGAGGNTHVRVFVGEREVQDIVVRAMNQAAARA